MIRILPLDIPNFIIASIGSGLAELLQSRSFEGRKRGRKGLFRTALSRAFVNFMAGVSNFLERGFSL